jgi:CheY-like chemotaxis protein
MDQENLQHTEISKASQPDEREVITLQQLLDSFRPYQEFVGEVSQGLLNLHEIQEDMMREFQARVQEQAQEQAQLSDRLRSEYEAKLAALSASEVAPDRSRSQKARTRVHANAEAISESNAPVATSPRRVLLLDDAELSRVLVSHYFKGLPVSIDYAKTAEQASGFIENARYDLLLIDSEFKIEPEWISWIKGQSGHTRITALSPNDHSLEEEARFQGLGFDSYLSRGEAKAALRSKLSSQLWGE